MERIIVNKDAFVLLYEYLLVVLPISFNISVTQSRQVQIQKHGLLLPPPKC